MFQRVYKNLENARREKQVDVERCPASVVEHVYSTVFSQVLKEGDS
jgi:hypothetical protein